MTSRSPEHPSGLLVSVQALRGCAACLVLAGHVRGTLIHHATELGLTDAAIPPFFGGFGVDLFFCISGFIMVVSSRRLFAVRHGWRTFAKRRLVRLVPLYWLFTLVFFAALIGGTHGWHGNTLAWLATSLLFIPFAAQGGAGAVVYPLYSLGWSLNYEMLFYVLFAACIFLPRNLAVGGALLGIGGLVLAGLVFDPGEAALAFWTTPITLEFGFGLLLAMVWLELPAGARIGVPVCLAIGLGAIGAVVADPMGVVAHSVGGITPNDFRRVLGWGMPAAMLLTGAVFWEKGRAWQGRAASVLKLFGDASYALYLVHPILLLLLIKLWSRFVVFHQAGFVGWPALGICFALSALVAGLATHVVVEKPLARWLQANLGRDAGIQFPRLAMAAAEDTSG